MDTTSPLNPDLDPSDFDRLGIQPQECRLTVIRRAATRAALMVRQSDERQSGEAALAPAPADSVSGTVNVGARELSKVVSSTYRLLDPRRRMDAVQRAHVGRILPGALLAAGHTKFHAGPFADAMLDSSDHDLAAPVLIGDTAITETVHHEPWSLDSARESLRLSAQICTKDLVRRYGSFRYAKRMRDLIRHPKTVMTLILTLLVASGWLIAWQRSHDVRMSRSPLAVQAEPTPVTSSTPVNTSTQPDEPTPSLDASHLAESESRSKPRVNVKKTDLGTFKTEVKVVENRDHQESTEQTRPTAVKRVSRPRGDWVLLIRSGAARIQLAEPLAIHDESPPGSNSPENAADRFPIFSTNEAQSTRNKLIERLVHVDYFQAADELTRLQSDADQLVDASAAGSVEHWTGEVIAVAPNWFTGPLSDLHTRWRRLAAVYDIDFSGFLEQTYFEATALPCSAQLNESLVERGLTVVQWMLSEDALEPCERLIVSLLPVANRVNRSEDVKQLDLLLVSVKLAVRTSKRVNERGSVDEATASDAVIIGRHLCFVSGNWIEGLRWLTRGSDARLAGLAKSELDLVESKSSKAQEWSDLSSAWKAYASGLSGHNEQTTRLHAIELLNHAISLGTPIEELRWALELEAMENGLPSSLQSAQEFADILAAQDSDIGKSVTASPPAAISTPKSPGAKNPSGVSSIFMEGKLVVADADEVVQLHYQTGVVIGPGTMAKMIRSPAWLFLPMHMEFVGKFSQPESGDVSFGINIATRGVHQTVYLNDEPVEIDPLEGVARRRVPPGEHSIRWIVDAAHFETLFLSLDF